MRVLRVLALLALALLVTASFSFAQNVGSAGIVSPSGSVVITPNGGATITPDGEFRITQDPVVTTRTFSFFGMTITYIDTVIRWTNGNLYSKSFAIEIRNRSGQLLSSFSSTSRYDLGGNLIAPRNFSTAWYTYNRNGAPTAETHYSYNYDTRYKLLSYDKAIISYTYTANGELETRSNRSYFYDGQGKQVSASFNTYNYSYNGDGSLQTETYIYEERGADNAIRAYSRSVTEYTYLPDGDVYNIRSGYDINGKLCVKTADITTDASGQTADYHVIYDLDENGAVQYTRVYDEYYALLGDLSGDGYMAPVDIISAIANPPEQDDMHLQVNGDIYLNSDRTWDFSHMTLEVIGNIIMDTSHPYDIYVQGDMTITSQGTIDLGGLSIYVTGDLTINAGTIKMNNTNLYAGSLNIDGNIILENNDGSIPIKESGELAGGTQEFSGPSGSIAMRGDTEVDSRMSMAMQKPLPEGVSMTGSIAGKGKINSNLVGIRDF